MLQTLTMLSYYHIYPTTAVSIVSLAGERCACMNTLQYGIDDNPIDCSFITNADFKLFYSYHIPLPKLFIHHFPFQPYDENGQKFSRTYSGL
jgi:hypothetical protein